MGVFLAQSTYLCGRDEQDEIGCGTQLDLASRHSRRRTPRPEIFGRDEVMPNISIFCSQPDADSKVSCYALAPN
jgi:hypothetical protein